MLNMCDGKRTPSRLKVQAELCLSVAKSSVVSEALAWEHGHHHYLHSAGVLLLVDSVEGPMPQTRFVTKKALALNKKVIVVVNKVDRPAARIDYVIDSTFQLFLDLGANDEQCDFPIVYASGME